MNGVRNFGITGLGAYTGGAGPAASTLQIVNSYGFASPSSAGKCHYFSGGSYYYTCYGNDLTNTSFSATPSAAYSQFYQNVAALRLPAARGTGLVPSVTAASGSASYTTPGTWLYGPAWAAVWNNMNVTSTSTNVVELTGNPAASVNAYAQLGVSTLAVNMMPCSGGGAFLFQSLNNATSLYWGERWECVLPFLRAPRRAQLTRPQAVQAAVPGGRLAVVVWRPKD